ncbi:MAG: ASKHA domain-containing protein [Candidatus Aminicenantaceae bacterium]
MTTKKIHILPFKASVEVEAEALILDAVKKAGLPLQAGCGGEGTCGECVVRILSGNYDRQGSAALPQELVIEGYALSCRTRIRDDLTILLPEFEELSIQSRIPDALPDEGSISGSLEVAPPVLSLELTVPAPMLEDNFSDLHRLEREIRKEIPLDTLGCEFPALKRLSGALREKNGRVRVVISIAPSGRDGTILAVRPSGGGERLLGMACDIGTSTVALHLVDLGNGGIVASASSLNQQIKCGEDIISRINYALKPGRLEELQSLIRGTVNALIARAAAAADVTAAEIYYASFSGNTTMLHLFLGLDPRYIREEPYVPAVNRVPEVKAGDLGLDMWPEGRVFLAPAVGSYVGGDITAGLLYTPMLQRDDAVSLFIDAGTNGELVVGNKDWLVTCACSAGPAFEGSGIKCGVPATQGAIEKLEILGDGTVDYATIGRGKPKGLCGSGLVDLLAGLFVRGLIDRQGKFIGKGGKGRLMETDEGRGFLVEEAAACFWGKALVITENDIANLIRTKGAVFSACALLLKNLGLTWERIEACHIAGGFGQNLNIENAIRIGLLPDLERDRFHYLGNSSLQGAYLILRTDKNKRLVAEVAKRMTYVELNTEPGYMNEYTGSLFLPHTDMDLFPSVRDLLELDRSEPRS